MASELLSSSSSWAKGPSALGVRHTLHPCQQHSDPRADVHVGLLPGLCPSWHLGSSSHPPCSQPAPKPISRAGRLRPSQRVVPAGNTGSIHPPPSATAAGGMGSPCTAHLGSGSDPVRLRLLYLRGAGPSCQHPSSSSGCTGSFVGPCSSIRKGSLFKVLFQGEMLLLKNRWVLQVSGGFVLIFITRWRGGKVLPSLSLLSSWHLCSGSALDGPGERRGPRSPCVWGLDAGKAPPYGPCAAGVLGLVPHKSGGSLPLEAQF